MQKQKTLSKKSKKVSNMEHGTKNESKINKSEVKKIKNSVLHEPKYEHYSKIVKVDTVPNAKKSVMVLKREYRKAKTPEKKERVKDVFRNTIGVATTQLDRKNLSTHEQKEFRQVRKVYREGLDSINKSERNYKLPNNAKHLMTLKKKMKASHKKEEYYNKKVLETNKKMDDLNIDSVLFATQTSGHITDSQQRAINKYADLQKERDKYFLQEMKYYDQYNDYNNKYYTALFDNIHVKHQALVKQRNNIYAEKEHIKQEQKIDGYSKGREERFRSLIKREKQLDKNIKTLEYNRKVAYELKDVSSLDLKKAVEIASK